LKAIITSNKHYVQKSLATVGASATVNVILAQAKDVPATGISTDIKTGASIKAVYVEMWVRSSEVSPGTVLLSLIKVPGLGILPTFAELVSLHTYTNKKNVFYHTQGLTNDADANAVPFVRQWFKIPKGKQRFGLDDILVVAISSQAAIDNVICGFAVYKEYT